MKLYLVCDFRENFRNYSTSNIGTAYSDHPTYNNMKEIMQCINELGFPCEYFGGIPELIHAADTKQVFQNCAFLNFTDGMDENYSRVQAPALLDILKVPYSGSGVFASVLMNNKHYSKLALQDSGILTAKSCLINKYIPLDRNAIKKWRFPIFVKPNCEGSSLGISECNVCHTLDYAEQLINELLQTFEEVIVEEYIYGIDITNYLIGNCNNYIINDVITAQLSTEDKFAIYGLREKQEKLRTLYYNDEIIPAETVKKIQAQSQIITQIIGVNDICRIDYRYNYETQELYFIEINSAPRFSSTSEIGFIAQKRGIAFSRMVEYYINTFLTRI